MLTPQNFREKTFERAVFGGYDMAAVDDFLDEAAGDYAAVAKENVVLKNKMKVLVDKIEEYRATEDSMRMTLLSAQKLSLQIEQESREKAEAALAQARDEAERIVREAYTQRATEEARLLEAKRESTRYIDNMRTLCTSQLNFLQNLEGMKLEEIPSAGSPEPEHSFAETVRNVETSAERMTDANAAGREISRVVSDVAFAPAPQAEAAEPTRTFSAPGAVMPGAADPNAQTGQFSFENLRFGK